MFTVKITKEAIEYMMFLTNAGTEIDAEEFLQTAISMCRIEAAQQGVQADGAGVCPFCDDKLFCAMCGEHVCL